MNFNLLRPKQVYHSILEISPEELFRTGMRGMIIDLDNTLTEWQNPVLSEKTISWLEKAKCLGFQLCFVSNNSTRRVQEVAQRMEIPFVARAQKPRRWSFRRALEIMGTRPEETAVIGDQIFTDILGGNRLGLYTILVPPINRREFFGTRLMRLLEAIILFKRR